MISLLKGERTPADGDGTNDAPFPCLNNAELRSEINGINFTDILASTQENLPSDLLLSPYPCFISLLNLDLYVLGDDALIS